MTEPQAHEVTPPITPFRMRSITPDRFDERRGKKPRDGEGLMRAALRKADRERELRRQGAIEALEKFSRGKSRKMKIAETDFALSELRKNDNPGITMRDIQDHNIEANGWDDGYGTAIDDITKWRDEQLAALKAEAVFSPKE